MSVVAEFASRIHTATPREPQRSLIPLRYPGREKKLYEIRAVIFDVYGTLINYWRPEFSDRNTRARILENAFGKTIDHFGMRPALEHMNPEGTPVATLRELYEGLIALHHDRARDKGISTPEVKIDEIWYVILLMLKRHGYDPLTLSLGTERDVARCFAWFYNSSALGGGFFPGVVDCLRKLKEQGVVLGILSNAQFYTPIDLTLFTRDQDASGELDDYQELFEEDLVVFSYELGWAKPSMKIFQRLFDSLYEYHILPAEVVLVGNDLSIDIAPAQEAGLKTALFVGDRESVFLHGKDREVTPDLTFESFGDLPNLLTMGAEKKQ